MASPTINDLWYAWLQANLPFNNATGISTTITPGSQVPNAISVASAAASASVLAPGAGATVATTPAINGVIKVECWLSFTAGTPTLADCKNIQVDFNGVVIKPVADITPGKVTGPFTFYGVGFNSANVKAIGAATAGVEYTATIVATKVA